jgi:hypothetical protein
MLHPLFDKNLSLIAWIKPGEHIFNIKMEWIAYISKNHAWSAKSGNWLGPVKELNCLDKNGKVFAWNPHGKISRSPRTSRPTRAIRLVRPNKQARPVKPERPLRNTSPAGRWSVLLLEDWLDQ